MEANCTGPLTLDIDTDMSELHLEPVAISPYTLPGNGDQGTAADTSPKGREVLGERSNRKDSVRAGERQHQHPNKSHHGIKGKQQRDRRKLREKRRSTGVVHLASTESTGGSTSGEEELSECDVGTETKRNTAQNESIGDLTSSAGQTPGDAGEPEARDLVTTVSGERKNSGRGPHNSNSHNRARLRSKNVARSEDMEADDELVSGGEERLGSVLTRILQFQGDKTDNDHERISPNSTMPLTLSNLAGAASGTSSEAGAGTKESGDLVNQLREKDRRIQYLELKIQQLSQVCRKTSSS